MKKHARRIFAAACGLALACACMFGCSGNSDEASQESSDAQGGESVQLQILAANSLSKAMEEAQAAYTEANPDVTFADTQYKSSGELNEMLAAGSEADILISASKGKMDDAENEGYVDPASRFNLFVNDLVMVTAEGDDAIDGLTLEDIASGEYTVCVGDDSVPAGNYANQSLSTVGCFTDPNGATGSDSDGKANGTDAYAGTPLEGKVVTDSSVGNVCSHAESGDVDVAFVYTSDVYRFGGVKVVGVVPADTHKNIVYPASVTSTTANAQAAQDFLAWCAEDPAAAQIWEKWGFELAAE